MKFKFNMQSALVSCFVAVFLSVAINQDANAFVAAPFVRDSSSSSSEPPYQTASSSIEETSDSSQIFYEASVSSYTPSSTTSRSIEASTNEGTSVSVSEVET